MGPIEALVTLAVAVASGLVLGTGLVLVLCASVDAHPAAVPTLLGALLAGAASMALVGLGGSALPESWASDFLPLTLPLAFAGFVVAGTMALWRSGRGPVGVGARWACRVVGVALMVGGLWWINANRPVLPRSFCGGWGHRQFDAALWRQANPGASNLRAEMVRSLLRDWRPRGRTRQQIVKVLGDPGSLDFAEAVYEVGWVSGFGIDPDYLVLHFDGRGRCDDWWLYQG
ncbi:MAG: hypothetical protein FJ313_01525 [Gemmatimonadetes bacterium]|nr:hypothetical protein [Gemmatimonadota bacterium]